MHPFPKFLALTLVALAAASVPFAAGLPAWAFPQAAPGGGAPRPAPDDGSAKHVPDSTVALTKKQIAAHGATVPDWHPEDHPPMPDIVQKGREPAVFACGYCHTPTGAGRPENTSLAGLTPDYIKQQVRAFKEGNRPGSDPKRGPQLAMIADAKALTDAELDQAAAYFSSIPPASFVKVVETDTVPQTYVAGNILAKSPAGGTEPIGNRIVEVPEELSRFELRDARTPYVAYVPVGSIQKGATLVVTGGGGRFPLCAICHGADLHGLGDIPRLAGRSPSYLMRQLYDIKNGGRKDLNAILMKSVVDNLTEDDMLNLVAYIASCKP